VLKLARAFLNAGVLENGLVSATEEGTPQGGPLSPLLSNIVLHALDCELESRGHRFVRYADDCNVYVRSARAGHRLMVNITRFITTRLKLKVNAAKSAVATARDRTFLGFSFTHGQRPKRRLADKTLVRVRARVRELTRRVRGVSLRQMVKELTAYLLGWRAYFGFCETPTILRRLDKWIRRRLRAVVWKQWARPGTRFRQLRKRGVNAKDAILTARSNRGPWRVTLTAALCWALPGAYFDSLGLPYLEQT
jgi:RNA-directed DNA polymerase